MHTKQKLYRIVAAILLLAMLTTFGCITKSEDGEENLPDDPDETPTYRVDAGEKAGAFIDLRERYAAGDEVVLKTYIVMDASPVVIADGERLSPRVSDDNLYLLYSFIMPAHDVEVSYSISGSDMVRQFSITYEGDTFRLVDPVYRATPFDTVTVKLGLIFDVVTSVRVNGKNAEQVDGPDGSYLYYQFEMPTEDVTVQIDSDNISIVDGEPIMMVDYYETVVATGDPDSESSYELVLYDDQNEKLLLIEYGKDGTETRYRVPQSVLTDLLDVIYGAKMDEWNDMEDTDTLEGMLYVCRFHAVGKDYRVSSEKMPQNGTEAFSEIRTILKSFASEDYLE